ncbi:acyl-CoA dehydrogenase family protein [Cytobacillus gottheilii]|uniref:acyl-CoA dehydrogenase family protein n=1 Tax=Cytobacillus gottheilii TaxID=859144 RepID=UPI0009BA15EC|nr:acyl-CoA dehydrogenase family protein [Cytobacillus gottheilii]
MDKANMVSHTPFLFYDSIHAPFTPEDFTDDDALIAKTAELFVKNEVKPKMDDIEKQQHAEVVDLFRKAGELGLLSIEIPEDYGGFQLDKSISGVVAEKLGWAGSFSVSFNIHAGVGTLPYIYYGTEEQKQKYLPKLGSGEWIGAYALTESNAGSDALNAKTTAKQLDDGSWVINGEKQWITNANVADVFLVFAKTDRGMTAFIVDRDFTGVSIGAEEEKMGIKGSSTATLILEDCHVPSENVLSEIGKGHLVALNILNLARLKLSFANVGTAKQALQLAIQYAGERQQFGKSISEFHMIQEKLANMALAIFGAESVSYRTAGYIDEVLSSKDSAADFNSLVSGFALEASICKVYASEALARNVDEAVQIHGGNGYMKDYTVEALYRDARISRIFEGTNEINRLTIAKNALKRTSLPQSMTDLKKKEKLTRQEGYIVGAVTLFDKVLKALTNKMQPKQVEQEVMRMLADMTTELYVMDSSYRRSLKYQDHEFIQLLSETICEEGFYKIASEAAVMIACSYENEMEREEKLNELSAIRVPTRSHSIIQKRKIAQVLLQKGQY